MNQSCKCNSVYHTVWRTWLFIDYSDEEWLYHQFSLPHTFSFEKVGRQMCRCSGFAYEFTWGEIFCMLCSEGPSVLCRTEQFRSIIGCKTFSYWHLLYCSWCTHYTFGLYLTTVVFCFKIHFQINNVESTSIHSMPISNGTWLGLGLDLLYILGAIQYFPDLSTVICSQWNNRSFFNVLEWLLYHLAVLVCITPLPLGRVSLTYIWRYKYNHVSQWIHLPRKPHLYPLYVSFYQGILVKKKTLVEKYGF